MILDKILCNVEWCNAVVGKNIHQIKRGKKKLKGESEMGG